MIIKVFKNFFSGDGNVSFEEFVEIVSNIGGSASSSSPTDQDQEEQELRDAFRVSLFSTYFKGLNLLYH